MGRKNKYNWQSVDWSKRNVDIARQLGCNPMAVSRQRAKRNAPNLHPQPRYSWKNINWNLPTNTIAEQLGCSIITVYYNRRKFCKPATTSRHFLRSAHNALRAALSGATPDVTQMPPADLMYLAKAAAVLRQACLQAGGKKRLVLNKRKVPRTGQTEALRQWLASKPTGFEFTAGEAHNALQGFGLQQVRNAIAFEVKKQRITVALPRQGTIPAIFRK